MNYQEKEYISKALKLMGAAEDAEAILPALEKKARIIYYKKGERIRRNNDPIYEMYICAEGLYKHVTYDSDGKPVLCCINLKDVPGLILNMNFDMNSAANVFIGDCIAITDCVVVSISLQDLRNLFLEMPQLRGIELGLYKSSTIYYSQMALIQRLKGLERYQAFQNWDPESWSCMNDNDKALCLDMDYSYWLRFKKKNGLV